MKKLIVLLAACLASSMLFANHWVSENPGNYSLVMALNGVIQINGVEQASDQLEVGAFCNGECRGSQMASVFPFTGQYIIMLSIDGEIGDQLTFKLYDHSIGQELDLTSPDPVTFDNDGLGSYFEPYILNFTGGEPQKYTITASANPSTGGTVTGGGEYTSGQSCTVYATANTGYTFTNWTENGSVVSTNANYSFTVNGNRNLVANFTANTYTVSVTANPSNGGTVTGAGSYSLGEQCILTATANTGYAFENWTENNIVITTSATYSFTVTDDRTLVANFTNQSVSYTITASASPTEGGSVSGAGSYQQGSTCIVTATANPGYTFTNWMENNAVISTEPTYSFEVTSSRSLVANFEEMANYWTPILGGYNMTILGVVVVDGQEQRSDLLEVGAFCGDECRGTARLEYVENTDRYIVILTVCSNATSGENISFRLYDHLLQQEIDKTCLNTLPFESDGLIGFGEEPYHIIFNGEVSVTVTVNPEGAGIIIGEGNYVLNETCTLTATANEGYMFANWTVDGEEVSSANPYSFIVNNAVELTANFNYIQSTHFSSGWNWWSTYIEQDNIDGLAMLKEGIGSNGLIIKSQTNSIGYYQNNWYGYFPITNEASYKINVTNDCTVDIIGSLAIAENHPITIHPSWTWIGYPISHPQSIANAIGSDFQPSNNDVIKHQGGSAVYYAGAWHPASFTFTPGYGYMYYSNASSDKVLTYRNNRELTSTIETTSSHWNANTQVTPNNLTMLAMVYVNGQEQRDEEMELGAFIDGECRGYAKLCYIEPLDAYYAIMTITGEQNDLVEFKLYDGLSGTTFHECNTPLTFEDNAIVGEMGNPYLIHFNNTTSLTEHGDSFKIYPNPVKRNQSFTLCIPDSETISEIVVFDALGNWGRSETGNNHLNQISLSVAGLYCVKVVCKSGYIYHGRLIIE